MKFSQKNKINIAVLFGGRSAEHEVSVQSAKNIIQALDVDKYSITLIGIDKNGLWHKFNISQLASMKMVVPGGQNNIGKAVSSCFDNGEFLIKGNADSNKIDVVFPILHGPMGEDGTIQGLLKIANVPFVGAGVLGSAVGMDKDVMKRLLRDAGLPIAQFIVFREHEKKEIFFDKIKRKIGVPFFVKPANLGSSVGISKVHNLNEFDSAVNFAFSYDNKIIFEENIKGREIECSVLGNEKPIASVCGEVIPKHEFYSYEAKYLDENGASLSIPARISKKLEKKIRKFAIDAFEALSCEGMARIDFFVSENEKVLINEINTIPGFTSISMYPKLWEASGISYGKLIDTLIKLAIKRFDKEKKLKTSFSN